MCLLSLFDEETFEIRFAASLNVAFRALNYRDLSPGVADYFIKSKHVTNGICKTEDGFKDVP